MKEVWIGNDLVVFRLGAGLDEAKTGALDPLAERFGRQQLDVMPALL
jgi:hypothetical protein